MSTINDYRISKHDSRNVLLEVRTEEVAPLNPLFCPKGVQAGEVYEKWTEMGFYQKPEQLYNRILDDMWIHGASEEDKMDLGLALSVIQQARIDIKIAIRERQTEQEEIWP